MLENVICIVVGFIGILGAFFWYAVAVKVDFVFGIVMCLIDIILALFVFSIPLFAGV